MIRVTIEIIPRGIEAQARHLGTIEIANDGSGTQDTGNYSVRLAKFHRPGQTWIRGAITGFDRIRKGPYDLLLHALLATVGPRNRRLIEELKNTTDPVEAP